MRIPAKSVGFLGGDGVTAALGVHAVEVRIHLPERGIEQFEFRAKRMRGGNKIFQPLYREQRFLHHISTAHHLAPPQNSLRFMTHQSANGFGTNSTNC
jgi:hypothetical protein